MDLKVMFVVVGVVVTGKVVLANEGKDFANNLLTCSEERPLNTCLRETLEDLRKYMEVGIPELGIERSEPFLIDRMDFDTSPSPGVLQSLVDIKSTFKNVTVSGLSTFQLRGINADLEARTMSLAIMVPTIRITGRYQAVGTVFLVKLEGNGPFNSTLQNVYGEGTASLLLAPKAGGGEKFVLNNLDIDFNIGGIEVYLDNLFDGKADSFAKAVNDVLNEKGTLIVDVVKPQIKIEVQTLVTSVMNSAFSKLPVEGFLSKIPREARTRPSFNPRGRRPLPQQQPFLSF